jgi:D-lactate dehydrogenase
MKIVRFSSFKDTEALFTDALAGPEMIFVAEPLSSANVQRAADAEVIAVFVDCDVSKAVIDAMPSLKLIVAESTGIDHIDAAAAKERGIAVANVPGYGVSSVAEFTFGLMLNLSRHITLASQEVKQSGKFDVRAFQGFDLQGKTLGIVGTGRIGSHVAEIGRGFGMKVIAFDAHPDQARAAELGFTYVTLPELAAQSDVITLHVPYMPETHHLISAELFARMKESVIVINTARGEVIDTLALVEALKSGKVAGAGLDVLEGERELHKEGDIIKMQVSEGHDLRPLIGDHMLMDMPNVIVTPHIAFHSKEADLDRVSRAVDAISLYSKGV